MTEDEMVGWHHQLDGHEFEKTLGVGDRTELNLPSTSPNLVSNSTLEPLL